MQQPPTLGQRMNFSHSSFSLRRGVRKAIQSTFAVIIAATGLSTSAAELTFDAWADAYSAEWVRGDPMEATTSQYFEGTDQDELDRQLTPISKTYRTSRVALARRGLADLTKFTPAELTESQRISTAMLAWPFWARVRIMICGAEAVDALIDGLACEPAAKAWTAFLRRLNSTC